MAGNALFSQSAGTTREITPDPRLYDCFPADYIDGLKENPRLLLYYNFYLDNAYFVSESKGKPSQGTDIRQVPWTEPGPDGKDRYFSEDLSAFDQKRFCALKYNFRVLPDRYTHYLLGETGKVLVFYPQRDFTAKYRQYLKSFNLESEK